MDPYVKRVVSRIKAEGLADIGEEVVKKISDAIFAEAIVEVQGNNVQWDDYLVGPINAAQGMINKMIDKIDGKEG